MKKFFLSILVAYSLFSCAQQRNSTVDSGYVFYRVQTPGTIAVDRNGQPKKEYRDTVYLVFVEIKGEAPVWKNAWSNDKMFSVTATEVKEKPLTVGKQIKTAEPILLTPKEGNRLYQLQLKKQANYVDPSFKVKAAELLLEGSLNTKKIVYIISRQVELVPPFFQ
jgi:hypothetical protein